MLQLGIITHDPPRHCYFRYQTSRAILKFPSCIIVVRLLGQVACDLNWDILMGGGKNSADHQMVKDTETEPSWLMPQAEIASVPGSRTFCESYSHTKKSLIFFHWIQETWCSRFICVDLSTVIFSYALFWLILHFFSMIQVKSGSWRIYS